ncbi:AT-rich interactive domain-containing protein 3C isoform X1 [Vicugna pacos]|uniref:AT-rich interactive domain-containing protein 3 n=1 Tax=Vicugna pacos TaxID=30538 RepID=A0ABM5D349_VICPA
MEALQRQQAARLAQGVGPLAPPRPPPPPRPSFPGSGSQTLQAPEGVLGEVGAEEEEDAQEDEDGEEAGAEDEVAEESRPGTRGTSSPSSQTPGPHPHEWTYEEQFKQLYELDADPKRKEFLDDLFSFMQKRGTPVNRVPIMAKQVLDLYALFRLVTAKGGLVEVINRKVHEVLVPVRVRNAGAQLPGGAPGRHRQQPTRGPPSGLHRRPALRLGGAAPSGHSRPSSGSSSGSRPRPTRAHAHARSPLCSGLRLRPASARLRAAEPKPHQERGEWNSNLSTGTACGPGLWTCTGEGGTRGAPREEGCADGACGPASTQCTPQFPAPWQGSPKGCPLCPSPACASFPGPNQPCTPTPNRAPFQRLTLREKLRVPAPLLRGEDTPPGPFFQGAHSRIQPWEVTPPMPCGLRAKEISFDVTSTSLKRESTPPWSTPAASTKEFCPQ